jgi:O-antigen/teichoic acid export membrane protein
VDVFVLSRVAPLAAVASYGVAGRAVDVSYLLAKQSTVALMPRLGDPSRREAAVRVGLGLFAGVVAAGMIALALAGQPLLVALVGPVAEGPLTAHVLALLAAAAILQSATDVPASMLTLSGRTAWASAVPIAVGGAANISISIAGAPHYGIWAVAGSTIIGNAITCVLIWWRARETLAWSAGAVARAFLPPMAAGAAAFAVAWPLAGYGSRGAIESLLVCSAALVAGGVTLVGIMACGGLRQMTAITSADR